MLGSLEDVGTLLVVVAYAAAEEVTAGGSSEIGTKVSVPPVGSSFVAVCVMKDTEAVGEAVVRYAAGEELEIEPEIAMSEAGAEAEAEAETEAEVEADVEVDTGIGENGCVVNVIVFDAVAVSLAVDVPAPVVSAG